MAATPEGRRLTEAHRVAQARLGAETVESMLAVWSLLDPADLDGTTPRWLRAALPIVQSQRSTSARLAANYLGTFRRIESAATDDLPLRLVEGVDQWAVTSSLTVTGPAAIKSAVGRGEQLGRAVDHAASGSSRAAMRHAMDGGRETIMRTVERDRRAHGWARATSGDPCGFCAMLASRGPAYTSEQTARFQSHDGCSCTAEPTYSLDAAWPPGSERYAELWDEVVVANGLGGAEARNAYRRAIEASR